MVSWLLGCNQAITTAAEVTEGQGQVAPLQELASSFVRYFGSIDLEKTDVAAGFVLAGVLQVQQRKALVVRRLEARGVRLAKAAGKVLSPRPDPPAKPATSDQLEAGGAAGGFREWLEVVSAGQDFCLTPTRWASRLAPQLDPEQSADIYIGAVLSLAAGDAAMYGNAAIFTILDMRL